jgi:hypothetical protein
MIIGVMMTMMMIMSRPGLAAIDQHRLNIILCVCDGVKRLEDITSSSVLNLRDESP